MTPAQLEAIGKLLYGQFWYTPMGADLDLNERTIRRWLTGESPIPAGVTTDLIGIAHKRPNVVRADIEARAKKALAMLKRVAQ